MSQSTLILDACCILNLAATNRMPDILSAWPGEVVASILPEREVLRLDDNASTCYEQIPLLEMTPPEMELFVELAYFIGDGEAATLALALLRESVPATDDKKALKLWERRATGRPVMETPDLIELWVNDQSPPTTEVATAIRAIEERAHFRPGRNHRTYKRWHELRG